MQKPAVGVTVNYTYGDSNWKDKLTSYGTLPITYDAIGNPLTYNGSTYTWTMGRQLSTIDKTGFDIDYKYNDAGIRIQKKVNTVTTNYHLVGDKVTYESDGTHAIYYTYDAQDKLVSMNLTEGVVSTEYYYIRNAQDDIIGLLDGNGNQVVSYTYSAWGDVVNIDGSLKTTVGELNPYRYRGYRYDTETGLYYLQSRYYNPQWGRFINADNVSVLDVSQNSLLAHNLFSYGLNNPITNIDPSGYKSFNLGIFGTIFWAVVSIIYTFKALFSGLKMFMKLNKAKDIINLLIFRVGAGMFVGLPSGFAIWLQTIITDYIGVVFAIIVDGNVALMTTLGVPALLLDCLFDMAVLAVAPDIVTAFKMLKAAYNGKSYKLEIGWWKWKYLPA